MVFKSFDSFPEAASISRKNTYACCTTCLDKVQSTKFAFGATQYTLERTRTRSLGWQPQVKASLLAPKDTKSTMQHAKQPIPEKLLVFQSLDFNYKS